MLSMWTGEANKNQLHRRSKIAILVAGTLWLLLVGAGLGYLLEYANKPGLQPPSDVQWPRNADLPRSGDKATLILAVHPQCPCTRATLGELEIIMARCFGKVAAKVLLYRPGGSRPDWSNTDLKRTAVRIPGVTVVDDVDGREALYFGAATSGQTLLYDRSGRLLFKGGITASRGHAGDNNGRSAVISLITTGTDRISSTPVFGCSLRSAPQF
jgi:hypothetical protein